MDRMQGITQVSYGPHYRFLFLTYSHLGKTELVAFLVAHMYVNISWFCVFLRFLLVPEEGFDLCATSMYVSCIYVRICSEIFSLFSRLL